MSNDFEHLGDRFFGNIGRGVIDPPEQRFYWQTDTATRQDPLRPDERLLYANKFHITPAEARRLFGFDDSTEQERNMGSWQNQDAAELARELLKDKTRGALREKVEAAVTHLQELVADTDCGSTLTFMKTNEEGDKHYFYAAVKNGDTWYTTAQNPRILEGDDELIEWLIGLEIWEAPQLQLTPSDQHAALASPIDVTSTES